jgi:hypothetical protein
MALAGCFAHCPIHRMLVRRTNDQRAPHHIIVGEGVGMILDGT